MRPTCILPHVIAGGLWAALATGAHAALEICNDTNTLQTVAIGYKGDRDWVSEGWWNIEAGDCAVVLAGGLTRRYYYYYAESSNEDFEGQDYRFCASDEIFTIEGDTGCEERGYETLSMREIDTGERARDFTLTLVNSGGNPTGTDKIAPKIEDESAPPTAEVNEGVNDSSSGPGGPGGGAPVTETVQDTTIVPEEIPMTVSAEDLMTDIPAGNHGRAFETTALFQGCELDGGREMCSFHAGDWKMRVFYRGPTPEALMYALEELAVNMPVYLKADMVETHGNTAAIVVRAVEPRPGDDVDSRLRATLQGDWVDTSDQRWEMTVSGSEIHFRQNGDYSGSRFMRIARQCDGATGEGPFLVQINAENNRRTCYSIDRAEPGRLDLTDVRRGRTTSYRKMR